MYHSGLFFATLVVQLAMANGLPVSNLYVRKDCPGCGEDNDVEETGDDGFVVNSRQYYRRKDGKPGNGCDDDDENCSTSPAATNASSASTTSPTTTTSPSPTSMTSGSSTTSSTPSPPTPPPLTPTPLIAASTSHSSITTGGIVGAAFGAVVIAGLALIVCGTYLHRWRKARKRGKGFVPATYLGSPPPSNPQFPRTEMSQMQSSPIISSAVASRMTSTPPHHYPHSITTASLSPLIPAATLEHSRSFTSSSNRRTSLSYTDGSLGHEPIHSVHEMSSSTWGASLHLNAHLNATHATLGHSTAGSTTRSSVASEPTGLLRALTGHQKILEAEDQKQSQGEPSDSKEDEAGIPEVLDPPPRYDA